MEYTLAAKLFIGAFLGAIGLSALWITWRWLVLAALPVIIGLAIYFIFTKAGVSYR